MRGWLRMFWDRILGIPETTVQPRQSTTTDVRVNAVLHHHQRVVENLNRELKLYEIEADRDRPKC